MDKYYVKKEWQRKTLILIAVYFLIIIFLNLFFIINKTKKLEKIEKQKKFFIQEQRFINTILSLPEEAKNYIYEIKKSLEEKRQFFQVVEMISKNVGVKVRDINEIQLSQEENVNFKTYSLSFSTSFKKIGECILMLEKQPNFVIKKLNILGNRKEPVHNIEIQVEVYNI